MILKKEKRKNKRIQISEQGLLISIEKNTEQYPVRLFDISAGGIGVLSNRYFPTDQKYFLKYLIFNRSFNLPVFIQWSISTVEGISAGCKKDFSITESPLAG